MRCLGGEAGVSRARRGHVADGQELLRPQQLLVLFLNSGLVPGPGTSGQTTERINRKD